MALFLRLTYLEFFRFENLRTLSPRALKIQGKLNILIELFIEKK